MDSSNHISQTLTWNPNKQFDGGFQKHSLFIYSALPSFFPKYPWSSNQQYEHKNLEDGGSTPKPQSVKLSMGHFLVLTLNKNQYKQPKYHRIQALNTHYFQYHDSVLNSLIPMILKFPSLWCSSLYVSVVIYKLGI